MDWGPPPLLPGSSEDLGARSQAHCGVQGGSGLAARFRGQPVGWAESQSLAGHSEELAWSGQGWQVPPQCGGGPTGRILLAPQGRMHKNAGLGAMPGRLPGPCGRGSRGPQDLQEEPRPPLPLPQGPALLLFWCPCGSFPQWASQSQSWCERAHGARRVDSKRLLHGDTDTVGRAQASAQGPGKAPSMHGSPRQPRCRQRHPGRTT